jgi:hypothetical protein
VKKLIFLERQKNENSCWAASKNKWIITDNDQQFSVCDYQLLSEKENPSHEAQEVQVHQAPEDTVRRGAKSQSHSVTKNRKITNVSRIKNSSFLTGLWPDQESRGMPSNPRILSLPNYQYCHCPARPGNLISIAKLRFPENSCIFCLENFKPDYCRS